MLTCSSGPIGTEVYPARRNATLRWLLRGKTWRITYLANLMGKYFRRPRAGASQLCTGKRVEGCLLQAARGKIPQVLGRFTSFLAWTREEGSFFGGGGGKDEEDDVQQCQKLPQDIVDFWHRTLVASAEWGRDHTLEGNEPFILTKTSMQISLGMFDIGTANGETHCIVSLVWLYVWLIGTPDHFLGIYLQHDPEGREVARAVEARASLEDSHRTSCAMSRKIVGKRGEGFVFDRGDSGERNIKRRQALDNPDEPLCISLLHRSREAA